MPGRNSLPGEHMACNAAPKRLKALVALLLQNLLDMTKQKRE